MNVMEELKEIMEKRLRKIRGVKNAKVLIQYDKPPLFFAKLTWFSYQFRWEAVRNKIISEVHDSPLVDSFDEQDIFIYR